jgi:hypothetical protein
MPDCIGHNLVRASGYPPDPPAGHASSEERPLPFETLKPIGKFPSCRMPCHELPTDRTPG